MNRLKFVCPKPILWHDIYQDLENAWIQDGGNGPSPPRPLILGLWHYSNDNDKKNTWDRTIDWAMQRGLQHLIPEIEPDQAYMVSQLTDWERIGPMGGPMYLEWDFSTKAKPSDARLKSALSALVSNWAYIAGSELSEHTIPLRFTGNKSRRLLVQADPSYRPAWGTWQRLSFGQGRREFTRLRKAVNECIRPHMVDHIDFVQSE